MIDVTTDKVHPKWDRNLRLYFEFLALKTRDGHILKIFKLFVKLECCIDAHMSLVKRQGSLDSMVLVKSCFTFKYWLVISVNVLLKSSSKFTKTIQTITVAGRYVCTSMLNTKYIVSWNAIVLEFGHLFLIVHLDI